MEKAEDAGVLAKRGRVQVLEKQWHYQHYQHNQSWSSPKKQLGKVGNGTVQ